jgi:hypothetical protein
VLLALAVAVGCGGAKPSQEIVPLRQLATYYGRYASQHEGMGPPNERELKEFIKSNSKLDDQQVDKLFASPRDKQPFVVFYGREMGVPNAKGGPAIAHEKEGVDGTRLVALPTTKVVPADEDRFKELTSTSP